MYKIVEVVGRSPNGYGEATQDAVDGVIRSGETVHYFEVVEHRGAVRENKSIEYQAVVKVGVVAK
ncbi:MAG: dodecin domain-containing protein [Candidatus Omnitrophica bacterium]|nr:dodecin domain-containing protein [Candidatus Omnitrophota bacterium]